MLIKFAKLVLLVEPKIYAVSYIGFIFLMSLLFDFIQIPITFLSDKDYFINMYFTRIIYVYVFVLLIPFMFCVHFTIDCADLQKLSLPAIRITVFIILETVVSDYIINGLSEIVGTCETHPEYDDEKISCVSNSFNWIALDISGHVYHAFYSMLIVIEECRYYEKWERLGRETKPIARCKNYDLLTPSQKLYQLFSPFVKIDFVSLGVLMVVLHLINLHTFVYYHTIFEMMAAGVLAAILWFVTYRVIFAYCETGDRPDEEPLLLADKNTFYDKI